MGGGGGVEGGGVGEVSKTIIGKGGITVLPQNVLGGLVTFWETPSPTPRAVINNRSLIIRNRT